MVSVNIPNELIEILGIVGTAIWTGIQQWMHYQHNQRLNKIETNGTGTPKQ